MSFTIQDGNFTLDGKAVFLNSGEIHYFRIPRDLWDKHLEAAREAGLSTVSSYVPWAWHESEEGVFDFDGSTHPERDLLGWLQRCHAHGLQCILKPGPFILAEFRGAGLPDWFLEKFSGAVKMRNRHGGIVASDGVSLFHETYLEKVGLWYDQVMPLISKHEIAKGGPVIMMQICNEIGVFSWLAHQGDYGGLVKDRFIEFISHKYANIHEVNRLWGTFYSDFKGIELPPDGREPYASRGDRGRDYDWHCFWRKYYGDYLRMLSGMARERGVTLPLYHNLPGWIYGSGYEFPLNITMYEDLYGDQSEIIFGVDHIPEYLSYRNMHDDRIINDIVVAMQGDKPLFAAEFQSGSREYHVVTNPREMELFYKASLAHGLKGWNYYMFSQGRNPRRKGYSGDTFYWFNPLTPEAERTSAFPLIQRTSQWLKTSENLILRAKRKAEVCVLFYPPYYATELERPVGEDCGLTFTPSAIRRQAYFDGLLKVLQVMNVDYDMADLSKATRQDLTKYKQTWAFCTDEMNARDQQCLVDYAKEGGQLVVFPYLPDREMSQNPCTLLREALHVSPAGSESVDSALIDVYDLKDIKCANPQVVYAEESLAGAEIIARNLNGSICGFSKSLGKGSVIHLGAWTGFDTEGHKPVFEKILEQSDAKLRQAFTDNFQINVRERFTDDKKGVLFVANYYNEEQRGKVSYTHPENGEMISIPYAGESMLWPALYGIFSPLCLEVFPGLKILHCTSELLNIAVMADHLEFTLFGDRDLDGEIVFEGDSCDKVLSANTNEIELSLVHDSKRIAILYSHKHQVNTHLNIVLKN